MVWFWVWCLLADSLLYDCGLLAVISGWCAVFGVDGAFLVFVVWFGFGCTSGCGFNCVFRFVL